MGTIIGDYLGATKGIHSKHQTVLADGLRVYCRVAMALRFWKSWRS